MQLFSQYVIDKIVYAVKPKEKHQKRLDSAEDYQILNCSYVDAPVCVPPANSSGETKAELETIAAAEALHKNPGKLEQKYDDEFAYAFKKVVEDAGLEYDDEYFNLLIKEAASITIRLKYKYNRPRPYQLGPVLGIDVTKYQSSTAKTPSGSLATNDVVVMGLDTPGAGTHMYLARVATEGNTAKVGQGQNDSGHNENIGDSTLTLMEIAA